MPDVKDRVPVNPTSDSELRYAPQTTRSSNGPSRAAAHVSVRRTFPQIVKSAAIAAACRLNRLFGSPGRQKFGILMYHRVVAPVRGVEAPTWNVTPDMLRRQLTGLRSAGFEPWPLKKLVRAHRESRKIPSKIFAVTFDDGFENNYLNAWPILQELNVPATIFLATKYLDTNGPFPFDDWSAAGSSDVPPAAWRPLTTPQCHEMLDSGLIDVGGHTHSHEHFLGRCDEFRRDMACCLESLHERFKIVRPAFAYPFGETSSELIDATKQFGFSCSLSTYGSRVKLGDDPYSWGRFNVESGDTSSTLAAKLSGWYTPFTAARKTFARPLTRFVGEALLLPVFS